MHVLDSAYYGHIAATKPMVLTLGTWNTVKGQVVEYRPIEPNGRRRVLDVELFLSQYEFVSLKRN